MQRSERDGYLLNAKPKYGLLVDPVAHFHLTNGAKVHDVIIKALPRSIENLEKNTLRQMHSG